ncbi:MAG: zinc transporter ZntB [Gammaproteobacteria bacterium]|jgi:zinc transporter|nr:zinc transporter ZntB [Gammaproteobacteria bacterium]
MPDESIPAGYRLAGATAGPAVALEAAPPWKGDGPPMWLHFDMADDQARAWINAQPALVVPVRELLLSEYVRPRYLPAGEGFALVLRGVNLNPGEEPDDMVAVRIWMDRTGILTCRRRRLRSIATIREQLEAGEGPRTAPDLLVQLMDYLGEFTEEYIDGLEKRLDRIEEDTETGYGSQDTGMQLGQLRRETASVRRSLAPQREAVEALLRATTLLNDSQRNAAREQLDRLSRHLEDLDLIRERSVVAHEQRVNQMAQQQNSRLFLLSVVAAIFLPLTFVTGLLGMNVGGIPGEGVAWAFWSILGASALVAVVLALWFRMRRWL